MAKDEICQEHSGHATQIETNKDNIETLFESVEKIKNRPPVWMLLAFATATGLIGWLIRS